MEPLLFHEATGVFADGTEETQLDRSHNNDKCSTAWIWTAFI